MRIRLNENENELFFVDVLVGIVFGLNNCFLKFLGIWSGKGNIMIFFYCIGSFRFSKDYIEISCFILRISVC